MNYLDEIKAAANARVYDVLAALGITERPRGGYIHICNPVEKDRHPSFTIWPERGGVCAFKDHRGFAGGDIIDLVAYLKGWSGGNDRRGRKEALRFLADLLGLKRLSPEQRKLDASRSIARARREDKARSEELATKQARARALWFGAAPLYGSRADTYLKCRGINLDMLPRGPRGAMRLPGLIRVLDNHPHVESGQILPCMIIGCVDPAGAIRAVHRTWLRPDGTDKADVEPNRKVWPDFRGLVIPLWRGATGLSVKEAAANGIRETLVLAEGIETALSAVIAAPAFRTWAFISLGNLQNVVLPECVDSVALCRENDWGNPSAVKGFERGRRALEKQGRPVAEVTALRGKDLNDTLRGLG